LLTRLIGWMLMPFAFLSQRVNLNSTAYFKFDGPVGLGNYVVGSGMFSLYYPSQNTYNVRSLDMSLSHGQHDQETIYVTVTGNMQDDNHHNADPKSGCEVWVLAWVGSSDTPTVLLENITGITAGAPYSFDIPPNATQVFTFLSGIHLSLSQEAGVTSYAAHCGANVDSINKRVTIDADATLNGVHGSVDVGLLVLTTTDPPFQVFTASEPTTGDFVSIPFPKPIDAACSLLTSFSGNFAGQGVVLMAANASIFIDDPTPVSAVDSLFIVNIVNHGNGTQNGQINACLVGQTHTGPVSMSKGLPTARRLALQNQHAS
jgi:hypothetical protein